MSVEPKILVAGLRFIQVAGGAGAITAFIGRQPLGVTICGGFMGLASVKLNHLAKSSPGAGKLTKPVRFVYVKLLALIILLLAAAIFITLLRSYHGVTTL